VRTFICRIGKDVLALVHHIVENVAQVNDDAIIYDEKYFSPVIVSASIPGSGSQIGLSILISILACPNKLDVGIFLWTSVVGDFRNEWVIYP
jgi:hypothetical protein